MSLLSSKLAKLRAILESMGSVLVAFSGGTDSSFLLAVALDELGKENVLAVTGVSASLPRHELLAAQAFAKGLKVRHQCIADILPKEFWDNGPKRCYYCKKALFIKLKRIAGKHKLCYVIDATNADDNHDYRPGNIALRELKVRSPLKEAGLTKKEIRMLSKKIGLKSWQKPAAACLASRIAYGDFITEQKLRMITKAEKFLQDLGLSQVRVRMHGKIARIEVARKDIPVSVEWRERIVSRLKSLGFVYVSLDLEGYRCGAMNEVLK